jgi:hypothetical protein
MKRMFLIGMFAGLLVPAAWGTMLVAGDLPLFFGGDVGTGAAVQGSSTDGIKYEQINPAILGIALAVGGGVGQNGSLSAATAYAQVLPAPVAVTFALAHAGIDPDLNVRAATHNLTAHNIQQA